MICLTQGTNIDDVEAFAESLPSNQKKLAYYKDYSSSINIIFNHLGMFLENNDLRRLLDYKFLMEFLKSENFIVKPSSDPEKIMEGVEGLVQKLLCLTRSINILMEKYQFFIQIDHEPAENFDEVDRRIDFNGPFEKLKKLFEIAEKKGYMEKLSDDDLKGHFRSTDCSNNYDRKKYDCQRIKWYGSDNEFVVLVDELADNKLVRYCSNLKYNKYEKQFMNNRGEPMRDLSKKSNNTKSSLKDYDYIRRFVWEMLEFFGDKKEVQKIK